MTKHNMARSGRASNDTTIFSVEEILRRRAKCLREMAAFDDQLAHHAERSLLRQEREIVHTSAAPPPGVKRDYFNRECKAGRDHDGNVIDASAVRVPNAFKVGRAWGAKDGDWLARTRPPPPKLSDAAKAKALAKKAARAETARLMREAKGTALPPEVRTDTTTTTPEPSTRWSDQLLTEAGFTRRRSA
ncbi:MAG: hypothetical protein KF850_34440 [Labilithrix sp.]|nr:hypothetical protein [Labilithrix sp.]MBX3217180.1 hypothetical protein [Labilithrix sp.]